MVRPCPSPVGRAQQLFPKRSNNFLVLGSSASLIGSELSTLVGLGLYTGLGRAFVSTFLGAWKTFSPKFGANLGSSGIMLWQEGKRIVLTLARGRLGVVRPKQLRFGCYGRRVAALGAQVERPREEVRYRISGAPSRCFEPSCCDTQPRFR